MASIAAAIGIFAAIGSVAGTASALVGPPIGCGGFGSTTCPDPDEKVPPEDPVMECRGPKIPAGFRCETYGLKETGSKPGRLPPVQVTDQVAGCLPGNQPSIAKQMTYSFTTTIGFSSGVAIKSVPGLSGIWRNILKEIGPQFGVTVSESVSFGESQTQRIPADYGMISWGIFAQDTIVSTADMSVIVVEKATVPQTSYYTASGVEFVTPVVAEKTGFPKGTTAKESRPFKDENEFRELCGPNAPLPPNLGRVPDPAVTPTPDPAVTPTPDPAAPPENGKETEERIATVSALVNEGEKAQAIAAHVATDLRNHLRTLRTVLIDDPARLATEVSSFRQAVTRRKLEGTINDEYADRLDAALARIAT
jgi:hypothetical protein